MNKNKHNKEQHQQTNKRLRPTHTHIHTYTCTRICACASVARGFRLSSQDLLHTTCDRKDAKSAMQIQRKTRRRTATLENTPPHGESHEINGDQRCTATWAPWTPPPLVLERERKREKQTGQDRRQRQRQNKKQTKRKQDSCWAGGGPEQMLKIRLPPRECIRAYIHTHTRQHK